MKISRWILFIFLVTVVLRVAFITIYKLIKIGSLDGFDIALVLIGIACGYIAFVSFKKIYPLRNN